MKGCLAAMEAPVASSWGILRRKRSGLCIVSERFYITASRLSEMGNPLQGWFRKLLFYPTELRGVAEL